MKYDISFQEQLTQIVAHTCHKSSVCEMRTVNVSSFTFSPNMDIDLFYAHFLPKLGDRVIISQSYDDTFKEKSKTGDVPEFSH